MIIDTRDESAPQPTGRNTPTLNYASPEKPADPIALGVQSGILSAGAMLFQALWAGGLFFYELLEQPPSSGNTAAKIAAFLLYLWPTLAGLVLGLHSVKKAGISGQNSLGVLGLILAVSVAILASYCMCYCGDETKRES